MKKISRRIPSTHLTVKAALNKAKAKKDSNPPGPKALKPDTATRLDGECTDFNKQFNTLTDAQAAYNNYTPVKVISRDKIRQYCSQFMHAIDFEIEQGVLTQADRAYYHIDVASGNFLPMGSEAELLQSAELLIDGETSRVAKGGTAIVYPTLATLTAASVDFSLKVDEHSNLSDALDIEREKLNKLTADAIDFIKVMWNEIESTFAAEPIESRRENSRAWGIVYASVNVNIPVTLEVVDAETGLPIKGAIAMLEAAKKEVTTNAEGEGELFTPEEGDDILRIVAEGYTTVEKPIDTSDGEALNLNIEMQKAA